VNFPLLASHRHIFPYGKATTCALRVCGCAGLRLKLLARESPHHKQLSVHPCSRSARPLCWCCSTGMSPHTRKSCGVHNCYHHTDCGQNCAGGHVACLRWHKRMRLGMDDHHGAGLWHRNSAVAAPHCRGSALSSFQGAQVSAAAGAVRVGAENTRSTCTCVSLSLHLPLPAPGVALLDCGDKLLLSYFFGMLSKGWALSPSILHPLIN
jgi:hypothetical protein